MYSPSTAFTWGSALPPHSCRGCCSGEDARTVPTRDSCNAARRSPNGWLDSPGPNACSGGFRVFRATIGPGAPVTSLVTRNRTGSERRLVEAESVPPWRAPMAAPRLTICCATPPRWPRRKPRNGAGAAKLRGCDRLPPAHPAPRSHQLLQRRAARPVRGKSRCH